MAAVEEEEMERGRGRCGAIFISGVKKNLIGELAVRGTDEWAWVKARKAAAAVAAIDKQSVLDLAVLKRIGDVFLLLFIYTVVRPFVCVYINEYALSPWSSQVPGLE